MTEKEIQPLSNGGKQINRVMLIIFGMALVFIIVIGFVGKGTSLKYPPADLNWNTGWILPDGSELLLPFADKQNDRIIIKKTLPQELTAQDSMVISSGYQPIEVEVDGKRLPVTGTFEGKIVYATAYSHVALSPEMSGKEVQITFLNQGGKQWVEIYSIELGNFNLIRQAAFSKDSVPVISGTFLIAISIFIFILGLLQRESAIKVMNKHTHNFVLASVVTAMFAVWMLVDTETVTLMLGGNPAYVFVNIFSYLFIMGPWLVQVILTTGKQNLFFHFLAMSGLIETAVIMVCAVFGFFNFSAYLTASHLIGVGVESSILYLSYDAFKKRKDTGSKMLFLQQYYLLL